MISQGKSGMLAGLVVVLFAPGLASAQLFPNLPIRRQRPDCSQENPQYKVIRQEYWGYYPTCWRKFPPGWGCPSPEAPNWEAAKQKLPLTPLENLSNSTKPEPPPANGAGPGEGPDRPGNAVRPDDRPRPGDPDMPKVPDPNEDIFKPRKPPAPNTTDPKAPVDPFTAPAPADAPKEPATSPAPLGELPPAASATTARRRPSLVAGMFGSRRR